MILKLILEFRLLVGFKPTIFVYLLVIKIHQRAQFSRRRIPNDALNICLMMADGNWLDVSSQFQGLLKEMESAIGFPTAQQSQQIDITYFVFLRSILFRSEKSSRVATVLNSHQQLSATCKYQYIEKSSLSRGNFLIQRVRSLIKERASKSFVLVLHQESYIYNLSGFCSSGIPTREHCFISKQINMKYYWYSNSRTS